VLRAHTSSLHDCNPDAPAQAAQQSTQRTTAGLPVLVAQSWHNPVNSKCYSQDAGAKAPSAAPSIAHSESVTTVQVVASLLSDRFPDATIQADQVVWPDMLLSQQLQRAETPGTPQAETFGPNSTDHWDFVLFQVTDQLLAGTYMAWL
jgi:hypothetical protein